ncbi:hypothetical protein GPJ56_003721 [Histomonas meleagridis]|uniref:uncharacterized protein n=1 Tax=Histomonas meleagridis TaxID=135588 RepID=UPI00355A7B11|nr:hypothetical protein GPJ56_003721 [Histomonas meleagridis]KAH0800561.1 hypothetical protein GO595_006629 [Histomonas meleagridis]
MLEKEFCTPLNVLPDSSKCRTEIQIPPKCILGQNSFGIKIISDDQKLFNLNVSFYPKKNIDDFLVNCNFNDVDYNNQPIFIPEIEPYSSILLNYNVISNISATETFHLEIEFETSSTGVSVITKEMEIDFQSPFSYDFKLFDDCYQPIPRGTTTLSVKNGSFFMVETTLSNVVDSPISITSIETSSSMVCDDLGLPIELLPSETLTFALKLLDNHTREIGVTFLANEIQSTLKLKLPTVKTSNSNLSFSLDYPLTVVKGKEFEAKIIVERSSVRNIDYSPIKLVIEKSKKFLINGPIQDDFYIFEGQKKVIPIRFLPLEAGSTILPVINLINTADVSNIKKFVAPIVVTFH